MELPPSSKYVARRDEAVSDAERESLTARLADEFEAGRIDHDTYNQALDTLYEAKNLGELVPVASVVPDVVGNQPAIVQQKPGQPGELAPIQSGGLQRFVVAGAVLIPVLLLLFLIAIIL